MAGGGGAETDGVHAARSMEAFAASSGTFSSGAMGFLLAIHEARGTMDDHGGHESMTQTRDWAPSVTPRSCGEREEERHGGCGYLKEKRSRAVWRWPLQVENNDVFLVKLLFRNFSVRRKRRFSLWTLEKCPR